MTVPIKAADGVPALFAPRRTVLDPILIDAAVRAGAEVRYGTTVIDLIEDREQVVGVVTRDRAGRVETVRTSLVVGADGRRSSVARLVHAPTTHRVAHTCAVSYGYASGVAADGYQWGYRPGTAVGLIPTNDGLTCVFAGSTPERLGRGGVAVLREVVAATSPATAQLVAAGRLRAPVRTFTGQPGFLRPAWGPGWALVGDAGSWKDPISAHGLTDALRDAELLAKAIVHWRNGVDTAEAFGDYEATRDRLTLPILRAGDEIAAMTWDDRRIVELLGGLNVTMADELQVIDGWALAGATTVRLIISPNPPICAYCAAPSGHPGCAGHAQQTTRYALARTGCPAHPSGAARNGAHRWIRAQPESLIRQVATAEGESRVRHARSRRRWSSATGRGQSPAGRSTHPPSSTGRPPAGIRWPGRQPPRSRRGSVR